MAVVLMKQLLESGVHFGHQTRKWNPKMKEYIFGERNGIYIIDLQKTSRQLTQSYNFIKQIASEGGRVLFVGTKKQAQDVIQSESERSGSAYVKERWLGGMLTNFSTIRKSVDKLEKILRMEEDGSIELRVKKERVMIGKQKERLEKFLNGIKDMTKLPQAVFVVDPSNEVIAVKEARKLKIPIIGIVDTNCDPDDVDYCIPANDDAIKAIKLIVSKIADAIMLGNNEYLEGKQAELQKAEEKAAEEKAIKEKATEKKVAEKSTEKTEKTEKAVKEIKEVKKDVEKKPVEKVENKKDEKTETKKVINKTEKKVEKKVVKKTAKDE